MIGYIKGKILHAKDGTVLLENNGVGYSILCSSEVYSKLVNAGSGEVFTYLAVREDGIFLYGFVNMEEKNMFLKLITVSGVGPKMGITVLSNMNLQSLAIAIATSDVKTLSKIKGLGKKTAERIILELREKVTSLDAPQDVIEKGKLVKEEKVSKLSSEDEDAIIALMAYGYSKQQSEVAIVKAKEKGASKIEDILLSAIRGM